MKKFFLIVVIVIAVIALWLIAYENHWYPNVTTVQNNSAQNSAQGTSAPSQAAADQNSNELLPIAATITAPDGAIISARVATTPAWQQLGLSYFPSLPVNQGMLFVFSQPGIYPFWMKGMNFPLDIIWLKQVSGDQYQVVGVASDLSPSSYPETFSPGVDSDDVLEINANQAAVLGIQNGAMMTIDNSN